MTAMLTGWMGYGTAVTGSVLAEPSDPGYGRHPFALAAPDTGIAWNPMGGTAGPATVAWGPLAIAGVFDAAQNGNLLFWMPLEQPITVPANGTMTLAANTLRFHFPDLDQPGPATRFWSGGSVIGLVGQHRSVVAGVALQMAGGVLSALAPMLGNTVTMATLPPVAPATGSGQLWNNGGIVSIA